MTTQYERLTLIVIQDPTAVNTYHNKNLLGEFDLQTEFLLTSAQPQTQRALMWHKVEYNLKKLLRKTKDESLVILQQQAEKIMLPSKKVTFFLGWKLGVPIVSRLL